MSYKIKGGFYEEIQKTKVFLKKNRQQNSSKNEKVNMENNY